MAAIRRNESTLPGDPLGHLGPAVMLRAMACECYLKAFGLRRGKLVLAAGGKFLRIPGMKNRPHDLVVLRETCCATCPLRSWTVATPSRRTGRRRFEYATESWNCLRASPSTTLASDSCVDWPLIVLFAAPVKHGRPSALRQRTRGRPFVRVTPRKHSKLSAPTRRCYRRFSHSKHSYEWVEQRTSRSGLDAILVPAAPDSHRARLRRMINEDSR
jgi:hypothetical protein